VLVGEPAGHDHDVGRRHLVERLGGDEREATRVVEHRPRPLGDEAPVDAGHVDERLRDHAWYIAYAPVDHPKIAVAVLVENGGFGAQAAAPIARAVFDYYLLGEQAPLPATPAPGPRDADDESD